MLLTPPVDSHPFWPAYLSLLHPDCEVSAAKPSFQLVRRATATVCVPCKMSRSGTTGATGTTNPVAKFITWTTYTGPVPTCEGHLQRFCAHCLRLAGDPQAPHLNLAFCDAEDRDELGRKRGKTMFLICRFCRERAFELPLQRELLECARGGVFAGRAAPFAAVTSAQEYIQLARGTAEQAARKALEEMFLHLNTRWGELLNHMIHFQRVVRSLRASCFHRGRLALTIQEQDLFQRAADAVWGVDVDTDDTDCDSWLHRFRHEIETGTYGEEEWRRDIETMRSSEPFLWPVLRDRLTRVCIQQWVMHRVQVGFWVMPHDEVEQLVTGVVKHDGIEAIARNARHPSYAPHEPLPLQQLERARINYRPEESHRLFLPSHRLLGMMNEEFAEQFVNRIESPLSEIVEWQKTRYPDWDAAEASCKQTTVPQLLEWLALPEAWVRHGLTSVYKNTNAPSEAGGETVVSSEGSPRIELVEADPEPQGFVVHDGWVGSDGDADCEDRDSFLDDGDIVLGADDDDTDSSTALTTSSALGKRKSSEEPRELNERPSRPRLGSGQTSQSSEVSTSTTLMTPNDSPDLALAEIHSPENDDEANAAEAQNSTPVAASITGTNTATPGQSPTLCKRKSPDGGGEEARPQQDKEAPKERSDEHCDKKPATNQTALHQTAPHQPATHQMAPQQAATHQAAPHPKTESLPKTESVPATPSSDYDILQASDSESTLSSEDFDDFEVIPWVPGAASELGPAVDELIRHSWYRAYEPLRECRCSICVRAREEETQRVLMLSAFGIDGGLRIA